MYAVISPADWGLARSSPELPGLRTIGLDPGDLERRAHECTYQWLLGQFDEEAGAFHGYYSALDDTFAPPQNVNLIAPWQLLAAYDRYGDVELMARAQRAADWLERNLVESHPMSLVCGGVRDNLKPAELWVKYTADYVLLNLGLWRRSHEARFKRRALQSARFIVQAEHHEFSTQNDDYWGRWEADGWQSFGRVVEAFLDLHEVTGDEDYLKHALTWGEHGLSLLQPDGCIYLIRGEYYNSDLAADEIRALAYLSEVTGRSEFLYGARAFADWHLRTQRPDGAWTLNVDRHGGVVSDYVGPGDPPNIAIALLRLHKLTGEIGYVVSALRGIHYALTRQVLPGSQHLHADNPRTHWGLWSWDPHYDYTMSGDQSTHLVRGIWFALDYLAAADDTIWKALAESGLHLPDPG